MKKFMLILLYKYIAWVVLKHKISFSRFFELNKVVKEA